MLSVCLPLALLIMASNAQANSLSGIQSAIDNYWSALKPNGDTAVLDRQSNINGQWFAAALRDENTRISHWSDNSKCGALAAPQEAIAQKAAKATIGSAGLSFRGQSNLLLAGDQYYSDLFHMPALEAAGDSRNPFPDLSKPDSYTNDEWKDLKSDAMTGVMYALSLRSASLIPVSLHERGAPNFGAVEDFIKALPPLRANSAKPLETRPKVYWLSRAILQCRRISGAGQTLSRNQRKALYDQKKSAKILAKAQTGFFSKGAKDINGRALFDGLGRSLVATPKVVSRLAEICQRGYYTSLAAAGGAAGKYAWFSISSQLNWERRGLNALNTISAGQANARNLGTKIQGMFAVPTAEIQLSDRNWKPTNTTWIPKSIREGAPDMTCTPRSSQ